MQHGGTTEHAETGPGTPTSHAGHGAAASGGADDATRKLLTLAGELVKDPVVQRQIQRDSALREAWSDPDVRRVVTKRP